ncbi:MAG: hypothetical protein WC554_06960 [Clostridia bacterium]
MENIAVKTKGTVRPFTARGTNPHEISPQSAMTLEAVATEAVSAHNFVLACSVNGVPGCSPFPQDDSLAGTIAALIAYATARGHSVQVDGDSGIDYAATLKKFIDTFAPFTYLVKTGLSAAEAPGIDADSLDPALKPRDNIIKISDHYTRTIAMDVNYVASTVTPTIEGPLLLVVDNTSGALYVAPKGISETGKTVAVIPGTMIINSSTGKIRADLSYDSLFVDVLF